MPPRKCPLPLTRPESLEGSSRTEDTDCCCSACLLALEEPAMMACTNTCSHVFHYDCIAQWSSRDNRCPQCKRRFQWIAEYGPDGSRVRYAHCKLVRQKGIENTEAAELRCEGCGDTLPQEADSSSPEEDIVLCTGMDGSCLATFHGHCAAELLYGRVKDLGYDRSDVDEGFLHLYFACPYCHSNGLVDPPPAKTSASARKRKKRHEHHRRQHKVPPPSTSASTVVEDPEGPDQRKRPHHASGFLMVDEGAPRATTSTPLPVAFKDASNSALADFLTRTAPDPSRPTSLANVAIYRQRRLARKAMRDRQAAAAAASSSSSAQAAAGGKDANLESSHQ